MKTTAEPTIAKDFLASAAQEGNATTAGLSFDLMTFREHSVTTVHDDYGKAKGLQQE